MHIWLKKNPCLIISLKRTPKVKMITLCKVQKVLHRVRLKQIEADCKLKEMNVPINIIAKEVNFFLDLELQKYSGNT